MSSSRELVITPGNTEKNYWRDIWYYKELFFFMTWRDTLLRYKQMAIGFAWAVIRPVLTMLIFTFIFSRLAKLPSGSMPYPLMVYAGMLPWQFFATAFTDSGNSLNNKESIITKVYFPRLIIPASAVMVSFVDFMVASMVLVFLFVGYSISPGWSLYFLPIFILLLILIALGAGLWISALSVKYKDFRYVIPFIVQMGLYLSPVGFSLSIIPEKVRFLYALNPMVGVIEGFRWSLFGIATEGLLLSIGLSFFISVIILATGLTYFRSVEKSLAEIL